MAKISVEAYNALAEKGLPMAAVWGFAAEEIRQDRATARMPFDDTHLRPGGTVSGPSLMALADYTMYAVLMGAIGAVELAVTTNLNINFLRKPGQHDVLAEGKMLKLGRRLAVIEVVLYSEGEAEPVAHVTGTYSIPPDAA